MWKFEQLKRHHPPPERCAGRSATAMRDGAECEQAVDDTGYDLLP